MYVLRKLRIPISPPASLKCRETAPLFAAKYPKHARISYYFVHTSDWRERTVGDRMASICRPFLWRAHAQSGFSDFIGRMQCDHKPIVREAYQGRRIRQA